MAQKTLILTNFTNVVNNCMFYTFSPPMNLFFLVSVLMPRIFKSNIRDEITI